jgi:uncharacterized Zn finger protein
MNVVISRNREGVREMFEVFVESETTEGIYYRITSDGDNWECTCPDHQIRGRECKHIKHAKDIKMIDRIREA